MNVVTRCHIVKSQAETLKLSFIGDVHYGSAGCNVSLLRRCVRKIEDDPDHYWIGVGDYCEYIMISDKRFRAREVDQQTKVADLEDWANMQTRQFAAEVAPIKQRCLGLHFGNHEDKLIERYHVDIHSRLCQMLETEYNLDLGYSAFIKWRNVRESKNGKSHHTIKLCGCHGFGGGRKSGAIVNRIEDLPLHFPYCHIYYMGHVHRRIGTVGVALDCTEQNDEIIQRPRAHVVTGTFLRTYTQNVGNYAERQMYPPTSLGVVSLIIKPFSGNDSRNIEIAAHCSSDGLPA